MQSQHQVVQSLGRTLSATIGWRDNKALQPHRPVLPDGTATGSDEVSQSYGVEGVCLEINVSYDTLCEYPIPRRLRSLCRREAPGGDVDGEVLLASLRPNVGPRCCAVWKHRMPTWRRGSVVTLEPCTTTLLHRFCFIKMLLIYVWFLLFSLGLFVYISI